MLVAGAVAGQTTVVVPVVQPMVDLGELVAVVKAAILVIPMYQLVLLI
jgi:hypothetical protein